MILNMVKDYLLKPEVIVQFIVLIMQVIQALNIKNEKKIEEKIKDVILVESQKVVNETISNEDKRNRVIEAVYYVLPKQVKVISETKLKEMINMIYHTYIKNNGVKGMNQDEETIIQR